MDKVSYLLKLPREKMAELKAVAKKKDLSVSSIIKLKVFDDKWNKEVRESKYE